MPLRRRREHAQRAELFDLQVREPEVDAFVVEPLPLAEERREGPRAGRVLAHQRSEISVAIQESMPVQPVDLNTLLEESDVVSIHCPLTPETHHLFGEAELQRMKNDAILINTARGPIVDEAALAKALQAGEIGGAGLDVFEREPEVHPELLRCENAMLLPHLGSATEATRRRMAEIAVGNAIAVLQGKAPTHPINQPSPERE